MKLRIYKIFLISVVILIHSINVSAAPINDLIKKWKQHGFLVFTIPVKLDALEPTSSLSAHTKLSLPLIYEPLVAIASKQELQPVLAASWLISTDNKSVTIVIKQKHFFSDNTEVTAQDVVNSINRVCSQNSKVFEEMKGLTGCEDHAKGKNVDAEMKVIGKYEIKFNINCSPTNFLFQLSSPSLVITKQTNHGLVGSGPYIVEEKNENYMVLNKNPYASSDNIAKNTGVAILYTNQNDIFSILKNDKPDGSIMYRMQDIWNFKDENYRLVKVNPNITEILVLNNQHFPFNKPIVRKALSSSIYNNFMQTCIPGAHKPYGVIPYGTGGSIASSPPKKFPEISAKEVFKEVPELKNKKTIVFIHQLDDLKNNCESEQITKAAKQFNIDIQFKYHKTYSTLEPLYLNHKLDGFIELYVFKNREAYSMLQFFTQAGENNANVNNNVIDEMLYKAIAEPSSHRRFQAYRKIAEYIQSEAILVPLFYMDHGNLLSTCLAETSDNFLFNPFSYIPQLNKIKGCNI